MPSYFAPDFATWNIVVIAVLGFVCVAPVIVKDVMCNYTRNPVIDMILYEIFRS